ncbi:MAG TPA: MFS transporter [Micromonosporaceae bacterium]
MLADVVYEGARSVAGPYLGQLGASAAVVGAVTGAGEAVALVLRLVSGPLADRTRRYWALAITGYALTCLSVPALALVGSLAAVSALYLLERLGKAVRSPAKDTLLSHAGTEVGQGRAFAVHEVLDQIGAFAGPLLVAAAIAVTGGYRLGFAVLALPGAVALILLVRLARRVPDPAALATRPTLVGGSLPAAFWRYTGFATLTMLGFATYGLIGFHLAERHLVAPALIPIVYAGAMATDAVAAVVTGRLYDRYGRRVLAVLPVLAALVPPLAFAGDAALAVGGALLWGAALGVQESTLRAGVADLAPPERRATAYGVFAAGYGLAWLVGGTLLGVLYGRSVTALVVVVVALQIVALVFLSLTRRSRVTH